MIPAPPVQACVSSHLVYLSMTCPGHPIGNAPVYEIFNLNKPLPRAPKIFTVIIFWVKINRDRLAKGNPSDSSCTTISRDFNGIFKDCFVLHPGHHSTFFL